MQPNQNSPTLDPEHRLPEHGTPDAAPLAATPTPPAPPAKSTAVEIVLQWLTYGLWVGTLIALSVLLSTTLTYFLVGGTGSYRFIVYVLATMLCLLPLAVILDKLYARHEPEHKQGFAAVVMVLHAVLAFLSALGALITGVVSVLSIALSTNSSSSTAVVIISSLVVAILGGLLFMRIINFPKLRRVMRFFPFIILGIAGLATILAIAGPFRAEVVLKNDRLIEDNLSTLNTSIQNYTTTNKKLPATLNDLDISDKYSEGANKLITNKLVSYEIVSKGSIAATTPTGAKVTAYGLATDKSPRYKLCVTYQRSNGNSALTDTSNDSYISTYNHPAGRQCYDQTVAVYDY